MLEAVSRTSADKPDILEIGMLIDQEIAVGAVFVLADAGFNDRGIFETWEAARDEFASGGDGIGTGDARLRVRICRGTVMVVSDFEAAVFDVGHAVEFVAQEKPGGKRGREEARVAGRNAEEENFLAGNEEAVGEQAGENFRQPGTAGEDECAGADFFAAGGCDGAEARA